MRGRKKSTKEANAEYLQKQGGTEVAEQKKQQEQDLNQLLKVRREKLADLQANGKDPFKIVKYDVTHHSQEIKDHFDELESQTVTIAGRMMSKRVMGKASFCHVQDLEGSIQSYVARDSLGEEAYKDFKKLDVGAQKQARSLFMLQRLLFCPRASRFFRRNSTV